jgi:hypothetical protein
MKIEGSDRGSTWLSTINYTVLKAYTFKVSTAQRRTLPKTQKFIVVLLTWNLFSWNLNFYISPKLKHKSLNSCTKYTIYTNNCFEFYPWFFSWTRIVEVDAGMKKKKTIAMSKVRGQRSCQPHWIVASAWHYPFRIHKFRPAKIEVSLS